ncbi:GDSL esterase/lipase 1-like isoform X1 [Prosopis cineraria]|uniref:GDSL esterase/lipase 1-like isoform X1 n=1 Tax=Prosopis cineraria TaxID=364024 RepID=UPI00240F1AD2|nr:GDSL esterase/lipase 1-like isoform X1 [Prosopis cineraria]
MASVAYVLCSVLSVLLNLESCIVEYKQQQHPLIQLNERKALFVFGDSLFDPGNDVYVKTDLKLTSIYWPYGETFFHHATGRFSDGRIVPDFIATFAGLPILPPYLEPKPHVFTDGANFASGGSCVLFNSSVYIDLPIQVIYFKRVVGLLKKQVGETQAKRILTDAVYLFSSGGNDYAKFYRKHPDANEESMRAFVKLVIGQLHNYLLEITRLGAKKIAFQNVGPMGCIPASRLSDGQCNEKENALARENNKALVLVMKRLEREVPGFKYSILDYYKAMEDKIFNPHEYGFKEGQIACCGGGAFRAKFVCGGYGEYPFELCKNPFEYVWFDGEHTSEKANLQLSRLIWEGGPLNITYPYTVRQLFQL